MDAFKTPEVLVVGNDGGKQAMCVELDDFVSGSLACVGHGAGDGDGIRDGWGFPFAPAVPIHLHIAELECSVTETVTEFPQRTGNGGSLQFELGRRDAGKIEGKLAD